MIYFIMIIFRESAENDKPLQSFPSVAAYSPSVREGSTECVANVHGF